MLIDQLVDQEGRAAQRGFMLQDLKLCSSSELWSSSKLRYLDDMTLHGGVKRRKFRS
jgi:hypothetical protein